MVCFQTALMILSEKNCGRHGSYTSTHLKKADGIEVNERLDIANTLADGFEGNSSSQHYTEKCKRFKVLKNGNLITLVQIIWKYIMSSDNLEINDELIPLCELKHL